MGRIRGEQLGPSARPVAIPDDLADPTVPKAVCKVVLPLHVRWSGPEKVYDLDVRRDRIRVYEQVLREGTEDDVRFFIRVEELIEIWSDLVLPNHVREVWAAWINRHRNPTLAC